MSMKRPVFKILLLAVFIYTTANNLAGKEIDHVRLYLEIDPAKKLMKGVLTP